MKLNYLSRPFTTHGQGNQEETSTLRRLSTASRVWLAAYEPNDPFPPQMIFEGVGYFDLERWRTAVAKASDANPGSRLILKGHLGASRWVDSGKTPLVRVADGRHWDGMSSEGAEMLMSGYHPRKGPMAEVVLIHGHPLRVAFLAHHAVMDGRGCLTWAENIFRALRGEKVLRSDDSMIEDDLLNVPKGKPVRTLGSRFSAPTGLARDSEQGIVWRRKKITGHYPKLLSQILALTAREARRQGAGKVRFGIPVDLRNRRLGLRSTGNLTNAIFIDVTTDDSPDSIANEIQRRLRIREDGIPTWEEKLIPHIPLWMLKKLLGNEARKAHNQGVYRQTGLVTNLGQLRIDSYQGGGFISQAYLAVPLCLESIPFSMTVCSVQNEADLVLSMPKVLASGGRLEDTLERIAGGLSSSGGDMLREPLRKSFRQTELVP
jgi:hypothetical protein